MSEVTLLLSLTSKSYLGTFCFWWEFTGYFPSFFFFFSFYLSRSLLFAFLPAFQLLMRFLAQISKLWNTKYRIAVTKKGLWSLLTDFCGLWIKPSGLIYSTQITNKQYQHRATVLGSFVKYLPEVEQIQTLPKEPICRREAMPSYLPLSGFIYWWAFLKKYLPVTWRGTPTGYVSQKAYQNMIEHIFCHTNYSCGLWTY